MCALARAAGASRLTGLYRPTAKNAMVSELYARLGFTLVPAGVGDTAGAGTTHWELLLDGWQPATVAMRVQDESLAASTATGR